MCSTEENEKGRKTLWLQNDEEESPDREPKTHAMKNKNRLWRTKSGEHPLVRDQTDAGLETPRRLRTTINTMSEHPTRAELRKLSRSNEDKKEKSNSNFLIETQQKSIPPWRSPCSLAHLIGTKNYF
jgi:hypothetical protein